MKRILCVLLSTMLLLGVCSLTACVAEESVETMPASEADLTIVLQIGNPVMQVNGTEKEIDPGRGTTPILQSDRTLLPIRAVIEEMGGSVGWNEEAQEATLTMGDDTIRLIIGSTTAYLNDAAQTLDVSPVVINDRTMLPIRFVAESFRFDVAWDEASQEIRITKNLDAQNDAASIREEDMVLINGGTFTMGSPENEAERDADEVQHAVTVSSFYMAKTELSQEEYQSVMGSNPSENQGANLPVENITWYEAIAYCNALSEAEGRTPCYTLTDNAVVWDRSADGYRLPTEAEWEYAARANTNTPFSFGDYVYDENANCYNAYGYNNDASGSWVNGYLSHTVAVTEYAPNAYGLYNMHGNAAEWVWDWYGAYDTESAENPAGPTSGHYKIARGGGWNDFPKHIRSAYRSAYPADAPLYSIGMRLVRNAEPIQDTATSTNAATDVSNGNTLIVYFSQTGNTEGLAEIIAEMTGADMFRIEREVPYSATQNSQGLYAEALTEYRENAIPNLRTYLEDEGLDIAQYDTILLGYCNWWASIPAPVRSFLTHYDLSGKTIIPFCSMGGGRFGQTISAVAKLAPDSTIKEGLDITYASYDRDAIAQWLTQSGIAVIN